jgi:O-6-methylguanine DNA methyltransferase
LNENNPSDNFPDITNVASNDPAFFSLFEQLDEYFNKERKLFDLPQDIIGTAFQMRVWGELKKIKYGETITYRQLAIRLGNAEAVRAVGRASSANPLPLVIPCHRLVGADGKLTGYSGGLEVKKILLGLENSVNPDLFSSNGI